MFQTLGVEIYKDDYVGMSMLHSYTLFTYRNTIGDLSSPVYSFWLEADGSDRKFGILMICLIWGSWIIN